MDRAAFFDVAAARRKIKAGQEALIEDFKAWQTNLNRDSRSGQ